MCHLGYICREKEDIFTSYFIKTTKFISFLPVSSSIDKDVDSFKTSFKSFVASVHIPITIVAHFRMAPDAFNGYVYND